MGAALYVLVKNTHSSSLWPGDIVQPPGVPQSTAAATLTATYNDIEAVKALFAANKGQIAGVILEPVVGNAGFIPPTKEFLLVRARISSDLHQI